MLAMILSWADFIQTVSRPPHSMLFVYFVCLIVSIFTTLLNKKLVDHNQVNRITEVVNEHNAKKKLLFKLAEENPKKYAKEYSKWQRRDASVKKMQQSVSLKRMKPALIQIVPMLAFFYVLRSLYNVDSGAFPIARTAMNSYDVPLIGGILQSQMYSVLGNITVSMGWIGYFGYYSLCSFLNSSMLQKIFKISKPAGKGASSLFDSSAQMDLPKPQ